MGSPPLDYESIDDRFQVLETRAIYQERTIDDLNEVVTKQQDQIDRLTSELERLRQTLLTIQEHGLKDVEEPPPPHY